MSGLAKAFSLADSYNVFAKYLARLISIVSSFSVENSVRDPALLDTENKGKVSVYNAKTKVNEELSFSEIDLSIFLPTKIEILHSGVLRFTPDRASCKVFRHPMLISRKVEITDVARSQPPLKK